MKKIDIIKNTRAKRDEEEKLKAKKDELDQNQDSFQ